MRETQTKKILLQGWGGWGEEYDRTREIALYKNVCLHTTKLQSSKHYGTGTKIEIQIKGIG